MIGSELAQRMGRHPVYAKPFEAVKIKFAFMLNLLGERNFTERELMDARDAMIHDCNRALINDVLGFPNNVEHEVDVAGPHDPTVTGDPHTNGADKDIKRRLVAFLRPDPMMLIEVEKKEVNTEPHLDVYQVTIEDGRGGSWCEAFPNEDTLRAFLRGIRVTYAMSDLQKLLPSFGDKASLQFTEQSIVQHLP